jgi:hypothetical protein
MKFHNEEFVAHLNSRSDSRAVGIRTGHWVMKKPELLLPIIEEFLSAIKK